MSSKHAGDAHPRGVMHIDPVEDLASPANADERRVEELARQLHSIAADLCDTVTPYWRGLSLLERRYLRDRARAMLKQSII